MGEEPPTKALVLHRTIHSLVKSSSILAWLLGSLTFGVLPDGVASGNANLSCGGGPGKFENLNSGSCGHQT